MRQVWPISVMVSLGMHGVALTGVALYWGVHDLTPQSRPEARLNIASQPVAASTATPAKPAAAEAVATPSAGQMLGSAAIPHSTAVSTAPAAVKAFAVGSPAAAPPATLPVDAVANVAPTPTVLTGMAATTTAAPSMTAPTESTPSLATLTATLPAVTSVDLPVVAATAVARTSTLLADIVPAATAALTAAPPTEPAPTPAALPVEMVAPLASPSTQLPDMRPNVLPAPATIAASNPSPALAPPSQRSTASLAWSGTDAPLDPVSLAAIQAFMQPGDLATSTASAGQLRDGIAETLAAVPCARLQTSFDPETGSIELRGHLPEEGLRAPVLAALQAQVGNGIAVTDRLRLLPRPQCGALTAIADVGLAQSTEQGTNSRVIGADTFVRDYALTEGQRLVFDMTAPDYPAIVYVDYFDAAGMVLHMQPNDQVPAVMSPAKSTLAVGQDAPGVPALQLRVGPPFGQEIAVAFAASTPLYDGVRPTIEPAEPYLVFLKQAVAQARANTPNFKGEWVYFFVTTAP